MPPGVAGSVRRPLQRCRLRLLLALRAARHRQVGGDRPAARHQGRAGRRAEIRQRGGALDAPRLPDRRHGRTDQHLLLRRRTASRSPASTSRSRATSTACARCCRSCSRASDVRVDGVGDGVMLSGSVANAAEVAAGLRYRDAPRRRRRQGRQQPHDPRPRSGHAQGDGRRSAARHHQAARHRSLRQPQLRQRRPQLQQRQSVHGARPAAGRRQRRSPGHLQVASARRCARWSAPA